MCVEVNTAYGSLSFHPVVPKGCIGVVGLGSILPLSAQPSRLPIILPFLQSSLRGLAP